MQQIKVFIASPLPTRGAPMLLNTRSFGTQSDVTTSDIPAKLLNLMCAHVSASRVPCH